MLIANGVDITTKYTDASQNNILFGFDKDYNIIYIDIVRNNKVIPILADCDIFSNTFGDYGVKSKRCGFLLWSNTIKSSIDIFQDLENKLDIDTFIKIFIVPPPKDVNLPKVSFDCAKSNFKKLAEDLKLKGLSTASTVSQIAEFNIRKNYALSIADNSNLGKMVDPSKREIIGRSSDGLSVLDKGILDQLANQGYDVRNARSAGNTALRELKKVLRSTDFQKALIAFFICQLKKVNNQGASDILNNLFNSKWKKEFQDWFKNFFCSQTMNKILKAFGAFKRPKFQPMDLNKAVRDALQKAIAKLIIELYQTTIRLVIKWLAECDNKDEKAPFSAQDQLALNNAIDDIFNNVDSPSNSPLNDVYDSLGLPNAANSAANGGQRASEQDKQAVKDLLSDISCILKTKEICRLMAEGNMSDDVYSVVKSLIEIKYPQLAKVLRTREDIIKLFTALGQVLNMAEICAAIPTHDTGDNRCADQGLEEVQRDALRSNGLTPDQIDAILKDERKKLDDRLDSILNAVNGRPEDLPLFCRDGVPGIINVGKVDEGYSDMFDGALDATFDQIYEQFNKDVKKWPANISESEDTTVDAATLSALLTLNQPNANTTEALNALKGTVLEPLYQKDENGNYLKDSDGNKIPQLDENGAQKFGPRSKNPQEQKERIISPILTQTLALPSGSYYNSSQTQHLTFKVSTKVEREKMEKMLKATLDKDLPANIKNIQAKYLGQLTAYITIDVATAILDTTAKITLSTQTGEGINDPDFWIGLDKFKQKNGDNDNLTSFINFGRKTVETLYLVIELFDIFISQVANDNNPRGPILQNPSLQSGGAFGANNTAGGSPRKEYPFGSPHPDNWTPVKFSKQSDALDIIYSSNGSPVGSVDPQGIVAAVSAQEAIVANTDVSKLSKDKAVYESILKDESIKDAFDQLSEAFNQPTIEKKLEETNVKAGNASSAPSKIEKLNNIEKMSLASGAFFDGIDHIMLDFNDTISDFENSIILGTLLRALKNAAKTVEQMNNEVKQAFKGQLDALKQLKDISTGFPDFEINYKYGLSGSVTGSQYTSLYNFYITKNNTNFMNVVQKEAVDIGAAKYIEENKLISNSELKNSSLQQVSFDNYLKQKNINGGYKKVEKDYFDKIYNDLNGSLFYKSDSNKVMNIRHLQILEQPETIEELCGIRNNPLDLDEIKKDVKNKFREDSCNYEPPRSDGKARDKMNPVEQNISDGLLLATTRIYIYDYYLKGIFLFDHYHMGMTADSVMLDFLANVFEAEMRSFENVYADRFLSEVDKYYSKKNPIKSADLAVEFPNALNLKREKFKELIREQILYISKRLSAKIETTKKEIIPDYETPKYLTGTGRSYDFFTQNSNKLATIKAVESANKVSFYYENNLLFVEDKDKLLENKEYRFLFEFCFPIRKYVSLVTIQEMVCAAARVQSARTFNPTKSLIKVKHNQMMNSSGYKNNRDSSDIPRPVVGSGDTKTAGELYMELIIEFIIKTPLKILKGLCEIADPNVFLASLPYNIAKPISLALNNELPFESQNAPLFLATPIIGVGLTFCFIPPTPFGIVYYMLGLWIDEDWQAPNKKVISNDPKINEIIKTSGVNIDACSLANRNYLNKKPPIKAGDLIIEYV